jgi:hypothetical protein
VPPKPGEPSRNPITEFLVALVDSSACHWVLSVFYSPLHTVMGAYYRLLNRVRPIRFWQEWQGQPEPKFPLPLTPNDLPIPTEGCDTCGTYMGTLIGTYVDATRLAALLPAGASLDPVHIHDGQHALILLFGYTENLHFAWWPLRGMNYLEFAVAVPHVKVDDGVKYVDDFFYLPILHLNRFYPVILGWMVGYRKLWSRFRTTDRTYGVETLLTGKKILDAEFSPCQTEDCANTDHWKVLLEEPHLNPFLGDKLFLHYHWEWSKAKLEPVDTNLMLHQDLPGLSAGSYSFKGIETGKWSDGRAPMGGVRFTVPFELLLPFSLSRLRKKMAVTEAAQTAAGK